MTEPRTAPALPAVPTEAPADGWSVILFDLDGTITDSGAEITQRITKALHIVDWPVPPLKELERLVGPPLYEGFIEVLGMSPAQATETLAAQRTIAELQGLGRRSAVYRGMSSLLAELSRLGVPLAVASSKGQHQVDSVLEHFDLAGYFTVMVGSDEAAGRTHKSQVVEEALRQLRERGVDVSRPVMVGDRVHDLEGAAEHGVPTVIVTWGYHNGEEAPGALARVDTAEQLRAQLLPGAE